MASKSNSLPIHAQRLAEVMDAHGLNDDQVAAASDLATATVYNVRRGRNQTVNRGTATSLSRGLKKLTRRTFAPSWLRGEPTR